MELTREEIQAMEAGDEMDALIEEHIFGATIHRASKKNPAIVGGCTVWHSIWKLYEPPQLYNQQTQYVDKLDPYSTDVAFAFKLWNFLQQQGHWLQINTTSIPEIIDLLIVINYSGERYKDAVILCEFPLAVCRAALLAKLPAPDGAGKG